MKYAAVAVGVCAAFAGPSGQQREEPRSREQLLPQSVDAWEPALATAPNGDVSVVAGQRRGSPRDKTLDQQQMIWRSEDGGATFEEPRPLTTEGSTHADQRLALDENGTIYVSYIDWAEDAKGRRGTRLRLARSQDRGRTFRSRPSPRTG